MAAIKNVALVGASGTLGKPVLTALLDNKFNVTVLARADSTATFPESVKVVQVDYSSLESLTNALKGQEAVVIALGPAGLPNQPLIIDAAIAAGVRRIIPSEFGVDVGNAKAAALPVFGYKVAARKHLEAKIAEGAKITYTYIIPCLFLDWGLDVGFLLRWQEGKPSIFNGGDVEFHLRWQEGKPSIFNGGDVEFHASNLATVAQAVVGVLEHEEETRDRAVFVRDLTTSQNKLLAAAKKAAPVKTNEWETVDVDTTELKKDLDAKLAKGDVDEIYKYIFIGFSDESYGGKFEKDDNELLGIKPAGDGILDGLWKKVLA